ncbi:hypothetical protein SLEP1_g26713 [Rubroshorea leprosula]|uniref:Uncharacterized protein n=1 Tax=Rubroshorea leprosula TaxID=152421 RepID=A0AAV5JN02_9ROSI|nr:hypothetical protein SLEP1_g26713 [Rubroshorea leprosula]
MGSSNQAIWVRRLGLGSTNPGEPRSSPGFIAWAWVRRTQVQTTNPGNDLGSPGFVEPKPKQQTQAIWVPGFDEPSWVPWNLELGFVESSARFLEPRAWVPRNPAPTAGFLRGEG